MPRSKSADIAIDLRNCIDNGTWPSDTALPNERKLASEFGVARNTIRNALHELEAENLIRREFVIRNQPAWIEMKRRRYSELRRAGYCQDHEVIVQALFSRNSELAHYSMMAHLLNGQRHLFGQSVAITSL